MRFLNTVTDGADVTFCSRIFHGWSLAGRLFVPNLWLTGDHFLGKLSAVGQQTRPTQLFIPLGVDKSVNGLQRWIPLKRQTRVMYCCMAAGQSPLARAGTAASAVHIHTYVHICLLI